MRNFLLATEKLFYNFFLIRYAFLFINYVIQKILWIYSRLRFGVLIKNKGYGCVCHWSTEIKYSENIFLSNRVVIGKNVTLGALSTINLHDDVRLSKGVVLETATLDFRGKTAPYKHISKPIVIEKGVWIGTNAQILGGVTIGENSIISAGAIVTKDVEKNSLMAGIPAKKISDTHVQN